MLAGIDEPSRRHRDVVDPVAVEREGESQRYRLEPPSIINLMSRLHTTRLQSANPHRARVVEGGGSGRRAISDIPPRLPHFINIY
jgi:hypothetical protein